MCGGTVALAFLNGVARANPETEFTELFEDWSNLVNFGVVVPIAGILILHLYEQTSQGFRQILRSGVVQLGESTTPGEYLKRVDRSINAPWIFWVSASLSVAGNIAISLNLGRDYWNGWGGGLPSMWFRFFAIVNHYMIANIMLKGVRIVIEIRRLFRYPVNPQPLHPDGCGGLLPLGRISIALNYFVSLIAVYIGVEAVGQKAPVDHPLFIPVIVTFALVAVPLFFAPLAKAHKAMSDQRTQILQVLNDEFQMTYSRVEGALQEKGIPLADAQKIESLERLYRIASRMPVWPIDMRVLAQFFLAVCLPLILSLLVEVFGRFFA